MSIAQNKALVIRFVQEGINPANMAVFDQVLADDVVDYVTSTGSPSGRENWKRNRLNMKAAFPDGSWEIADIAAENDIVFVRARFRGTHQGAFQGIPATGKSVVAEGIHICRIANNQIVEHWVNNDDLGMLRQLGVM